MDALFIGENRFTPALYINNAVKMYKKLNRAYAWTHTQINGNGNAYLVYYDGSNYYKGDAIPAQTIDGPENGSSNSSLYSIDGTLYIKYSTNDVQTVDVNVQSYCRISNNNVAYIRNNNLYYYIYNASQSYLIDNTGGWQLLTDCSSSASDSTLFGIKNDSLYMIGYINDVTATSPRTSIELIDDTGIWTKLKGYSYSTTSTDETRKTIGIKDSKLYAITQKSIVEISPETGWVDFTRYIASSKDTIFGIRNGSLYKIDLNNNTYTVTLMDDTETWLKATPNNLFLTQSGKIYKYTNNALTQIGTKTNWTKLVGSNGSCGIDSDGKVYFNIASYGDSKSINDENIYSDISLTAALEATVSNLPVAVIYTGNTTVDKHSVYTIGKPDVGFTTYSDTDMTVKSTISAVNENNNTITDEYYSYTRDPSLDGIFSGISPDTSKQLLTLADILNAMR